jgi:hypothetical protein
MIMKGPKRKMRGMMLVKIFKWLKQCIFRLVQIPAEAPEVKK